MATGVHISKKNESIPYSANTIIVAKGGSNIYMITAASNSEWYVEKFIPPDPEVTYTGIVEWWKSVKRKNMLSQRFRTRKEALAAVKNEEACFDGEYKFLPEVIRALETGEILNVRYWGGRRSGKSRHFTVTNLMDFEEEDGQVTWLAQVVEHGMTDEKTYRVDRMELLPVRLGEIAENP